MSYPLIGGSGKRLLERHMADRPGRAEYAARTSGFFPRPPRRPRSAWDSAGGGGGRGPPPCQAGMLSSAIGSEVGCFEPPAGSTVMPTPAAPSTAPSISTA